MNKNRADIKKFHEKGQGQAYVLLTEVLQGAEIETLKWTDHRGTLKPLDNAQKARLYNVRKNYNLIRAAGVSGLIRGLQKLKQLIERTQDIGATLILMILQAHIITLIHLPMMHLYIQTIPIIHKI